MPFEILLLLLIGAICHASWNALVKGNSDDRIAFLCTIVFFYSLFGFISTFFLPALNSETFVWLGISVVTHLLYKIFLINAYETGDLGRVYPIARGLSPILILLFGIIILGESYNALQVIAVCVAAFGIMILIFQPQQNWQKADLQSVVYAVIVSFCIAFYTLFDAAGARQALNPHSYIAWAFAAEIVLFFPYAYYKRGKKLFSSFKKNIKIGFLGGLMSLSAYWIVIYASTVTKTAYVSSVRESSVVLAVLIGMFFLKERYSFARIFSACLITLAIIIIQLTK